MTAFALRGGYPEHMDYARTDVLFARGIAEVPNPWNHDAGEVELLHRRQIAKKNADLHGRSCRLPSVIRVRYAQEVVRAWLTPTLVARLLERIRHFATRDADGAIRVLVAPPIKASFNHNVNMLCYVYAAEVCFALQAAADAAGMRALMMISPNLMLTEYGGTRTESGVLGRLARQSVQVSVEIAGRNVLLVDDHAEACSVLAVGYDALVKAGANVVGISTVSAIPDATNIRVHGEVRRALSDLVGDVDALNRALRPAGLRLDTLTNREALITYAFLAPAATLDTAPEFRRLLEVVGYDFSVTEGQYGSVLEALAQPQMTVDALGRLIDAEAHGSRIHLLLPSQELVWRPALSPTVFLSELERGAPHMFIKASGFICYDGPEVFTY